MTVNDYDRWRALKRNLEHVRKSLPEEEGCVAALDGEVVGLLSVFGLADNAFNEAIVDLCAEAADHHFCHRG